MEDINENQDEFFYLNELPFTQTAMENFSKLVDEWPDQIGVADIVLFITALYIKMRESMDPEELTTQLQKALYMTESTIQIYKHDFPGRYPTTRQEAELKWEINDIFKDVNETD